jgi:hypothetical protein
VRGASGCAAGGGVVGKAGLGFDAQALSESTAAATRLRRRALPVLKFVTMGKASPFAGAPTAQDKNYESGVTQVLCRWCAGIAAHT